MRSEFALFFSPRFVSFFWPWRCRGDGTVTVMPGHRETRRCWELVMKKWAQNFGTENLQTQKFLIGFPWIFLAAGFSLGFPWTFPIWFPLDSWKIPALEKPLNSIGLGEANVDALSKNGSTPLLVASREGHTPVCKVWTPLNLESPSIDFFFETRELQ